MFGYVQQLLKDSSVASLVPTSPRCVRQITSEIDFVNARLIVEYGPGDGAITEYLLERMHADARLLTIETNRHFVSVLRGRFRDKRLHIVHDNVVNVCAVCNKLGLGPIDYIISGIPFSLIDKDSRHKIIQDSSLLLKPSGKFVIYQALSAFTLLRELQRDFLITDSRFLLFNFPPLYVLEAIPQLQQLQSSAWAQ